MESMLNVLSSHIPEFLSFLGGVLTGSTITLRFTRSHRASFGSSVVDQSKVRAGRDFAGRDNVAGNQYRSDGHQTVVGRDQIQGNQIRIDNNQE
jgi:hypothetical protein